MFGIIAGVSYKGRKSFKGYKNDIELEFDKATNTVKISWTYHDKAYLGKKGNSRYGNRQRQCNSYLSREEAEAELLEIANREWLKGIERAEELKAKGVKPSSGAPSKSDKVYASSYLRALENERITSSLIPRTINDSRRDVNRFADWLDKHHPSIELKDVDDDVAKSYCDYLSKNYSHSSVKTYRAHLVYTFNCIVSMFKKSSNKITNPFREFRLKSKGEGRKEIFNFEQLTYILKRAGENEKYKQPARIQRFAFFYLLIVTGWRVGDLAEFQWKDVNFKKRVITNLHGKTQDSTEVHTRVYMTNLMKEVLLALYELKRPKEYEEYLFSVNRGGVKNLRQRNVTNAQTHMDHMREELELHEVSKRGKNKVHAHTIHSIRGSFITHMAPKRFDETLVNYIVGHKLTGVNEKHYKRYDSDPELYTRDIIETMESLVDARHAFNVALYGEKHARGLMMEGDSIADMPDGWEEYLLKERFWTEEGIAYLRFKSVQGSPPSVIKGMIRSLNKFRVEQGARWVDAALIVKYTGLPYAGMPDMNDPKAREALARARARQQSGSSE